MHQRFKTLAAAAAVAGAFAAPGVQAQGIDFNGYLRTGVGGTTEGGNLQCFSGQFPIRAKYRLGNECDTYGEVQLSAPFGKKDGAYGKYVLMLALQGGDESDYSSVRGSSDTFNIAGRQNYFQLGGFFPKGPLEDAKVWVGKRYYNRHDVHINDHFYWNNSGQGAGIEDITVGPAKLAFAYHQNGGNSQPANAILGNRYSMRFYGIPLFGTLEGEVVYLKGTTAGPGTTGTGSMLFLEHTANLPLPNSWNKFAVILGDKLGGNGFEWLPTYAGGDKVDGKQVRLIDQLYFEIPGTNISGLATAGYAERKISGVKDTWITAGIRPQYNFTANYSVAVEAGYDQGKTTGGTTKKIAKLTVAPQLTLAGGFWARPVVRAFATYAKWNTPNGDAGTNGTFGTKTSGANFGVQVEAWW
jgi:maltoporin